MRVVMAASEVVPYAKTGGLADVAGALPSALRRLGVDVAVVMPKYATITPERFPLRRREWTLQVPVSSRTVTASVLQSEMDDLVPVYFIEADEYFARSGLYGTPDGDYLDNAERFAFFSRAILALLQHLGAPDVLHCHDWQTGLAPAFLRADAGRYPELMDLRTVLTIHNIGYQGVFWHFDWHLLNLDWRYFTPEWIEFYDKINYLKGGIVFSDAITTVSPTYAQEIQTPELGHGLDGVLVARRQVLCGILNGVDYAEWSPENDAYIAARYSADDPSGKAVCKADLQAAMGLPVDPKLPLIGIVSRLADQKGFDLIAEIAAQLLRKRVQVVVLGSGDARYQNLLPELAARFPKHLAVRIAFDNTLAHKIEAGSDMFLMPSRYEPCGLNQIYSLRYGTIPIVRATGGLQDTIVDFAPRRGRGTGFKFSEYSSAALLSCIERALRTYRTPEAWRTLMRNAMQADFSWDRSAEAYINLYRRITAHAMPMGDVAGGRYSRTI
jgi:starch synthase